MKYSNPTDLEIRQLILGATILVEQVEKSFFLWRPCNPFPAVSQNRGLLALLPAASVQPSLEAHPEAPAQHHAACALRGPPALSPLLWSRPALKEQVALLDGPELGSSESGGRLRLSLGRLAS